MWSCNHLQAASRAHKLLIIGEQLFFEEFKHAKTYNHYQDINERQVSIVDSHRYE